MFTGRIVCFVLSLTVAFLFVPGGTSARADAIAILSVSERFLTQIRSDCRIDDDAALTVRVVPLSATASPLAAADDASVTRTIEEALRSGGARLAISYDADKLAKELPGTATGAKAAQALADAAKTADVVIWPEVTLLDEGRATLRLIALRSAPPCKSVTQTEISITQSSRATHIRRLMTSVARRVLNESGIPADATIELLPVRNRNNRYSDCDAYFRATLSEAFRRESESSANSAQGALTPRRVQVRTVAHPSSSDTPSDAIVIDGQWGVAAASGGTSTAGKTHIWISLTVKRDGKEIYTRARQTIVGAACDARTYSFTDKIVADAAIDPGVLLVHAARPVFRANRDTLSVEISSRLAANRSLELYCWYLSDEALAYIVTPHPGMPETEVLRGGAAAKRFPADFGLPPQDLTRPSTDLFHCFASATPLPVALKRKWMARFGASGPGPNGEIEESEIFDFLTLMRRQPGVVEGLTRIVVQ